MRGSQRARDILQAMGADAFKFHTVYRGFGPNAPQTRQRPLSGRQIAQLKKEYILENKPWPFEQQSPLRRTPHIRELPPKGHKWERVRVEREKQIAANMVKMPQLIADSKAKRKLPDDIPLLDKMFLTRKQLYQKYVKSRQR